MNILPIFNVKFQYLIVITTIKKGTIDNIDIFGNYKLNGEEYVDIQFEDGSVALSVQKSMFDEVYGPYSEINS